MSLRITKASDPMLVERINICLYSGPGVGKTTMGYTANNPLLLDADEGSYRAGNRKDTVLVQKWEDMAAVEASDLAPYSTVVVDTAGRALDKLTVSIIGGNPKLGRAGALTLQGYGELKAKFTAWMKMLNSLGKDVVLLCHMDEQRRGDDVIDRLDVQGGSKGEIYKSVDAMGKLYVQGKERMLDFSPRENSYGKNPGAFDIIRVPSPLPADFLAVLIQQIKDKLNYLGKQQKAEQDMIEEWTIAIEACTTAEEFTRYIPEATKAGTVVKMLLHTAATKKGFAFNRLTGCYEAKAEPKAVAKKKAAQEELVGFGATDGD
jgi:hypothetical protein